MELEETITDPKVFNLLKAFYNKYTKPLEEEIERLEQELEKTRNAKDRYFRIAYKRVSDTKAGN